ncbi:MAG: hypothetical protein U5J63_01285 [Fodinibius sp.]|nr:hypothetical protein [Fodinibius sp.]
MELGNVSFRRDHDFQNVLSLPIDFDEDFKIWRYLSLPKFLKFLEDEYLYLAPLSEFDDPFEGTFPKTYPETVENFVEKYNMPKGPAQGYEYHLKQVKDHAFINCWHINNYESAAMWSIYSKTNESVAVKSSFSTLQEEVGNQAQLGAVAYIDYETDYIPQGNMNFHCLCKRKSYAYEKEFRVIEYDMESHLGGGESDDFKTVDINLGDLIESIYVSPDAPEYFPELISSISEKYGYDFDINKSKIDADPFY